MPNLLTHSFFAIEAYNNFLNSEELGFKIDFEAFKLGSVGPDPLFYGGVSVTSLHPLLALKKMGNKIHKSDNKTITFAYDSNLTLMSENEEKKNLLKSFYLGQLAHYILDSTTHPYIYYWSGFDDEGHLTGHYHYRHAHFEACIDSSICYIKKETSYIKNPKSMIKIGSEDLKIISECYVQVLESFFGYKIPKFYYKGAVNNMLRFASLANKKTKAFAIGPLKKMRNPNKFHEEVFNLNHLEWRHPATGEKSNKTFIDLYQEALNKFSMCLNEFKKNQSIFEAYSILESEIDFEGKKIGTVKKYKDTSETLYSE